MENLPQEEKPETSKDFESKDFKYKKSAVLDFLNREKAGEEDVEGGFYENAGKIDENIHELIERLNQLPFLYTTGCCGGHVFSREKSHTVYTSGDVHFITNGSEKSLEFIRELSKIIEKFNGAELSESNSAYILEFGKSFGRERINTFTAIKMEIKREKLKAEILELAEKFY